MNIIDAATNGDTKSIKVFINLGADINAKDNGNTALMAASRYSHTRSSLDTVKLLIDYGADINATNNDGDTALLLAIQYSNSTSSLDTVKLLIDRGADISASLIKASKNGNINVVRFLLDRGADVNATDSQLRTPLMYATSRNAFDIVRLLLDRGADVNAKEQRGFTALMNAKDSVNMIILLLDHGADPFDKNNDNKSAIDYCTRPECNQLLSSYIWKSLYDRDMKMARQYSQSGDVRLPIDVWKLILLNKRQQQLCMNLSSDKNKEVLRSFALTMNIPVTDEMTKGQLCGIISRQLAYGHFYSKESEKFIERRVRDDIRKVKEVAQKFGIDTDRPVDLILKDLAELMKY